MSSKKNLKKKSEAKKKKSKFPLPLPFEDFDDLKTKRRKFLSFICEYYTSQNRSKSAWISTSCAYRGKDAEGKVAACAIGLFLKDKDVEEGDLEEQAFPHLPKAMQHLGLPFLYDIQALHDEDENWDDEGLTDLGQIVKKSIKLSYHL